jgi:hypothetical protein
VVNPSKVVSHEELAKIGDARLNLNSDLPPSEDTAAKRYVSRNSYLRRSRRRRCQIAAKLKPAPSSAIDAGSGTAATSSVITTSPLPVRKSATRIWFAPASKEPPPPDRLRPR